MSRIVISISIDDGLYSLLKSKGVVNFSHWFNDAGWVALRSDVSSGFSKEQEELFVEALEKIRQTFSDGGNVKEAAQYWSGVLKQKQLELIPSELARRALQ